MDEIGGLYIDMPLIVACKPNPLRDAAGRQSPPVGGVPQDPFGEESRTDTSCGTRPSRLRLTNAATRAVDERRITSAELVDITVLTASIGARHDEHRAQGAHP